MFANNEIYKPFLQTLSSRSIWQKWTTCPNTMARCPQRRGAQCSRIGCIGLRPALLFWSEKILQKPVLCSSDNCRSRISSKLLRNETK